MGLFLSSTEEKLYGITVGLHPPWNWGEAVVTRNIFLVIKKHLLKHIKIYSMVDANRYPCGKSLNTGLDVGLSTNLDIRLVNTSHVLDFSVRTAVDVIKDLSAKNVERSSQVFIHVAGVNELVLWTLLSLFKKLNMRHCRLHLIIHNYGPITQKIELLPYEIRTYIEARMFSVLTTSMITRRMFINNKKVFYIPAPYIFTPEDELITTCTCFDGCGLLNQVLADLKNRDILLYVGHLRRQRFNYPLVLSVLKRLVSIGHKEVVLLIVAPKSSKDYDVNYKHALIMSKLASSLQIADHVNIIMGNICENCKRKLFENSKMFLFLPLHRSQSMDPPMSVLEAMAHGNVVVTTRYLSLPYMIKSGHNGILLSDHSIERLTSIISKLLSDDNYFNQISRNAITYVTNNHSSSVVVRYLSTLYESLE